MIDFKKIIFCLLVVVVISSNSVFAERFIPDGQKITNVGISWVSNSGLKLPTEGDEIEITFSMSPYLESINTNETFYVHYILAKPNGEFARIGHATIQKGPYSKNIKYTARTNQKLTIPGIWKIYYVVTTNSDSKKIAEALFNSSSPEEYLRKVYLHSEEVHVLSFYESTSIKISNNSLLVSLIGAIGTFLAFLLGLFANIIIDKHNNSPKIKVTASSNGFVSDGVNQTQTFSIEVINYGRVGVTLDSVGVLLKNPKKKLHFLRGSITPLNLPHELLPGKKYSVIRNYAQMKRDIENKIPDKAYVTDQTGKEYLSKSIENMFKMTPLEEGDSERTS